MDELTATQQAIVDEYQLDLARLMLRTKERLVRAGMAEYALAPDAVYAATEKVVEDGMYAVLAGFGE